MKLSVAANYEFDLVSQLALFPVAEVYGKFPADSVGGGRPSYMGTPLTRHDWDVYVSLLHRHDIEFTYLLNSSCTQRLCENRGYCDGIAREAVRIDPAFQREQSVQFRETREQLTDRRLRGV